MNCVLSLLISVEIIIIGFTLVRILVLRKKTSIKFIKNIRSLNELRKIEQEEEKELKQQRDEFIKLDDEVIEAGAELKSKVIYHLKLCKENNIDPFR